MDERHCLQLSPEMEAVLDELCRVRGLDKAMVVRNAERLMAYLNDTGRTRDLLIRSGEFVWDDE